MAMRRQVRWVSGLVVAGLLAGTLGGTAHLVPARAAASTFSIPSAEVARAIARAAEERAPFVELEVLTGSLDDLARLQDEVTRAGGEVLLVEENYAQVRVPTAAATSVLASASVSAAGLNQVAGTGLTELAPSGEALAAEVVAAAAQANFDAIGLESLRAATSATGAGVKVAVIDSGIDPGHPDLQTTPAGGRKVVDWKDFTGEGRVSLPEAVASGETYTAPDGRTYVLPDLTAGASARFGYWEESHVSGRINRDLNRNGSPVDKFGVLAVAPGWGSEFELVYVDTNDNRSFRDETPLAVYRKSGGSVRLGPFRTGPAAEAQLSVVLADLDPAGMWASFGFDSLGHGTQVAGVVAASGPNLTGIAPGAELMALKVITSRDEGSWFAIREAIQYAAAEGAKVINVSLGGLPLAAAFDSTASAFLDQIATQYGVLINLAAGNTGPGLASGATLGSPSAVLSTGAYYSPAMWQRDYGLVVPTEGVWWQSGMGPRADGAVLPSLIAPGGSPTTSPRWLHRSGYTTAVGTSIATAHVTGGAALLVELAWREGLVDDPRSLRRALEQGARPLDGVEAFEQGAGLLRLPEAYAELRHIRQVPELAAAGSGGGGGLYIRAYQPGNDAFVLTNLTGSATRFDVRSSAGWVAPAFQSMTLPAYGERQLPLRFTPPTLPGVYSASVELFHPGQAAPSITLPITFVQPVTLDRQQRFTAMKQLPVARYERYFVEVAEGTQSLRVTTRVVGSAETLAAGTVQVQIFRPDGELLYRSDPIGSDGLGLTADFSTSEPVAGVWEVVVTALPDSAGRHLSASYSVTVEAPHMAPELPLRYSVEPGGRTTVNVPVTHTGAPTEVKVEAMGLVAADVSEEWRTLTQLYQIDEFTTSGLTGLLLLEIEDVYPASSDLDIILYRYDVSTGWRRFWSAQNASPGGETLSYANLPAGRYRVFVQHNGQPPPDLQYQYRRRAAPQAYSLSITEPARRRVTGQTWQVPMTIYAPTRPGRYVGYVLLSDANTGESLTWYPVEVSVGEPELEVRPMVAQLTSGTPGTVVFEVRERETGRLVDTVLTVDGKRYLTRNGRVSVPVVPSGPLLQLDVEVDMAGYQPYRATIPVAVATEASVGTASAGAGADAEGLAAEKEQWRRRLEALLR